MGFIILACEGKEDCMRGSPIRKTEPRKSGPNGASHSSVKSQSAMEFLMTYGWSILIIAVVLGALFQLGVFNSANLGPRAPTGNCKILRVAGMSNLEGTCSGVVPQEVAVFNGGSSYVNIANNPYIQLNGAFTLSFWLRINSVSGTGYDGSFSQGNGWIVYYACGGVLCGPSYKRAGTTEHSWASAPVLNQWKYYAVTYDGSGKLYLYANGQQTNYFPGALPTDSDMSPLLFGRGDYYGNQFLSNAQIYNTSLDANQIQALYLKGIGAAPIDPNHIVGWWPLNGDANDYSGNNNNGAATTISYTSSWLSGYTPP